MAFGNTEADVLSSLAGRLARLEHRITTEDDQAHCAKPAAALRSRTSAAASWRRSIRTGTKNELSEQFGTDVAERAADQQAAASALIQQAAKPLHDPKLREASDRDQEELTS